MSHPVIKPRDDKGYDFHCYFRSGSGEILLEAFEVSISGPEIRSGRIRFTVRSDRRDFEGDSLYLLSAEFHGSMTWCGNGCIFNGVLSEFVWRTEEDVDVQMEVTPSGDGIYVPKGPLPGGDIAAYKGKPCPMMAVEITAYPRGGENVDH